MAPPTSDEQVQAASRARRQRNREELRASIIETAERILVADGAEAVTMRAIAERIGYSATTIYHHFEDRDELLATVLERAFGEFRRGLAAALTSTDDHPEQVRRMGRAYVDFALEHPAHYQLMFVQRPEFLMHAGPEEGASYQEALTALAQLVAEAPAGRAGRIEPRDGAHALWGAMHGISALATGFAVYEEDQARQATEATLDLLVSGLWNEEPGR